MRHLLPWWAKILIKVVFSRIPLDYRFWSFFRVFRHGNMDNPAHALKIFRYHFDRSQLSPMADGLSVLELGVGDSVASALIAHTFGARRCHLIDVGRYATEDLSSYHRVIEQLRLAGADPQTFEEEAGFQQMLETYGAEYLTDGLRSLKRLPDNSVDFIWSEAVLEHVRLAEFDATLAELYRIARPGAVLSHRIDLRDHLAFGLNNLRFSSGLWESEFMAKSGFYTNRIRYSDMLNRFKYAGFDVDVVVVDKWPDLPTPRDCLRAEFAVLPDDELLVSCFDVILRPVKSFDKGIGS